LQIGQWRGYDLEVSQREREAAGAEKLIRRRYVNMADGRAVELMLLCGPAGPISVHPPTVCLTAGGWTQASQPASVKISGGGTNEADVFWSALFRRMQPDSGLPVQVLWSWNPGSYWMTPAHPRVTFAGRPYLYKLYVISPIVPGVDAERDSVSVTFLRTALPYIASAIYSGEKEE